MLRTRQKKADTHTHTQQNSIRNSVMMDSFMPSKRPKFESAFSKQGPSKADPNLGTTYRSITADQINSGTLLRSKKMM